MDEQECRDVGRSDPTSTHDRILQGSGAVSKGGIDARTVIQQGSYLADLTFPYRVLQGPLPTAEGDALEHQQPDRAEHYCR